MGASCTRVDDGEDGNRGAGAHTIDAVHDGSAGVYLGSRGIDATRAWSFIFPRGAGCGKTGSRVFCSHPERPGLPKASVVGQRPASYEYTRYVQSTLAELRSKALMAPLGPRHLSSNVLKLW